MSDWQPIKTAPKDGTWVAVKSGDAMPDVARFYRGRWETISNTLDWDRWHYDSWTVDEWMPLPLPSSKETPND